MTTIEEINVGTESNTITEDTDASIELNKSQDRSFTQDEVDAIVKARLNKQKSKYDDINLSEYRTLKQEKEKTIVEEQKARGEFETILQEQKEKFEERFDGLRSQLHKEKIEGAILKSAGGRNAISPEQVAQLLQGRVTLSEEGEVHVLNDKGEVMYDTDKATPISIDSLVNTFLDSSPHFLRAGPSGSGSTGNVGETKTKTMDVSTLDMTNASDRETYKKLKDQGKI
jgi:hypothetical protein